ncbi:disease resistance protein RPP8-like [Pistacia vera]|uniref:disease resistance protein RPP8-like n=1 Tax=Pistacia vera TaxID=55513 RepID=UPI0012634DB6|nr:disease resistance protein RPP8-like [Pistacia vera]
MAEFTVNFAIETLGSLLVQETKLLRSVKKEVESIKRELEIIRSFLRDADTRAAAEEEGESNGGVVSTWVKQVREEAYHIEDVIDEYILNEAKHHEHDGKGLTVFLHKMCCFMNEIKVRHGISSEIKDIKSSLVDIQRRAEHYNLRHIDQGDVVPHDSRVGSFFIQDAEVVGIESTIDQLIGLLVSGTSNRSVVGLVGKGGLGKTTLAGKIYKNDTVKKHFDCQAWITVGKECTKMDILRKTIQEFDRVTGFTHGEMDKMEENDMLTALDRQLKDKCCMVVFDDVWKTDFWGYIEYALIENNKETKLLRSVKKEVESIKRELEIIRSFLKDADTRAAAEEEGESNGGGMSTWVKQVREEAYHIEDVIDEYVLNKAKHHEHDGKGLTGFLRKMCCFMKELKVCHEISSKIKDIKSSLADIQRRAEYYNLRHIDQGDVILHDSRVGSFFIQGDEVVGIESIREQLIGLLVSGTSNRSVVVVVGEGGLGRTILAGKIYNNNIVKKHFDYQA